MQRVRQQIAETRLQTDESLGAERANENWTVEPSGVRRVRLETRRQATDDQLSTERSSSDVAVSALGESTLALANAQRERAQREDVFGIVTHDLRSPLCAIVANAEYIEQTSTEASVREAAQDVSRDAARMSRLLTDLLDITRAEAGTLRMVKHHHDVGALVSEVVHSFHPLYAAGGHTLGLEMPDRSTVAPFDRDRIVQVLSNLLDNALKFAPTNGVVRLSVHRRAGHIEVGVHDNGRGILASALPRVFERFWQVEQDVRGLGLGLYICQQIVEAHGGKIWVESEPGEGATFRFTLPLS